MREFHDFIRILEENPEWKAELRRVVLTDELLKLPEIVRELVEAQRRTEERLNTLTARVDALAEAQRRTEERLNTLTARVDALAEAQRRTEERLNTLTARVDALAEAQRRTEERLNTLTARVDALAEAQRRTEERLNALTARVDALAEAQRKTEETLRSLAIDVAELKGDALERRYRERPFAYFGRLIRRAHTLSSDELVDLIDRGMNEGVLSREEAEEIALTDAVVRGRLWEDRTEVYLVVEVSWGVGRYDVERALRRAEILGKLGLRAIPVVAGKGIMEDAARLASQRGVRQVIDGRVVG